MIKPGSIPFVSSIFVLTGSYKWMRLLGFSILVGFYLLGRSSSPIVNPVTFSHSLPHIPVAFKNFSNGATAFHLLAGPLTIFSQPGVVIEHLFLVLRLVSIHPPIKPGLVYLFLFAQVLFS